MRSTGFFFISLTLHVLCVLAIALTPTHTADTRPEPLPLEVKMVEPAAPPVAAAAAPAAKPAVKKVAKVAKQEKAVERPAAVVAKAEPLPEPQEQEKDTLIPVKETAPVGVEAATTEEPEAEKAPEVAPTPPAPSIPAPAEMPKAGADKEGAVDYLKLKQVAGNKPPVYPLPARLAHRQGQLELLYRVTNEGKVTDIQVTKSSGFKDLDNEAVRAVAQFRFVPGQEGWARHPVNFALKGAVATMPSQLRGKGTPSQAQAD